ncbi:MAG: MFS transporter [Solobacterium sp.]|nr:MFS transporter [Solobacterium sp.]
MDRQKQSIYWMVVFAGCGLIGTCLGLGANVAGLFFTPIADEFGAGRGLVASTLTVYNLVHAFAGMTAPRFLTKYGLRKTALAGTVIQVTCTALLSMCTNVTSMMILNGLRGLASGLIGIVTVSIMINYWFNQKNALMISIAMGFSGIVSAVLSPFLSELIISDGWRTGYMVIAGLNLLFNLPAILLPIALMPSQKGMEPYGGTAQENNTGTGSHDEIKQKIPAAMFAVLLAFTVCAAACTALPQHFAGIAESFQLMSAGAVMVSACMISNTAGKIILGALIDRIGIKLSVTAYTLVIAAGAVLLALSRASSLLIAGAAMFGLCYALGTVGIASLTREMFDTGLYSRVYPKLTLRTTLSSAVFTTLIGMTYDISGTYIPAILFLAG